MTRELDNAAVIQFSDMVHQKAQQIKARLRPYVTIKQMTGQVMAYDGIGSVEAQEVLGRVQKVVFTDIEHLRRKISKRRFALTLPIDAEDKRSVLLDPESQYAPATVKAMERKFDRVIIEAMFADVYTGKDFETTVTAANDGVETVDATSGLTYEKLLEVIQNFMDNDVGNDTPIKIVAGFSGEEHTDFMKEAELINADYSNQFVVDKGRVNAAMGLEFVYFAGAVANPILSVASSVRTNFAMTNEAICVGMAKEMSVKIQERSDYIEVDQVQIVGTFGAVRTEGVQIQKITTTVVA